MAASGAAARRAGPRAAPPARASRLPRLLVLLAAAAAGPGPGPGGAAQLYRPGQDAVWVLDSGGVRSATTNSSAAWLVQFYSSWCGHCIGYAPTWRALAADVQDWAAAIRVAALDCADDKNQDVCRAYDIRFYPTLRYFKAFTRGFSTGESFKGPDRELRTVRQAMIDFLQNHTEGRRPPACPALDPIPPSSVLALLASGSGRHVAILFETNGSYVGREVALDLVPYENVVVHRALDGDKALLEKLGVTSLPSCYLMHPNGSHGLVHVAKPLRSFFASYLKSLPGVRRKPPALPARPSEDSPVTVVWREFDKSKLYSADLESGLHHLLRMELAAHRSLEGAELKTLKDFVTVIAKLVPGRPPVRKLLETLREWLASLPLDRVPYSAILDLVDNKMRMAGMSLPNRTTWVGCQGSRPELRGYPCSLWTLFHTLTVRAATHPEALLGTGLEDDPPAVLQTVRRYVHTFFGCRECGEHFENMAKESLDTVKTADQAILWLWRAHNTVNGRLAGHLSEDPAFPKVPWPTPDLCAACHEEVRGVHSWAEGRVLAFLKHHYSAHNLLHAYAADLGDGSWDTAPGRSLRPAAPSHGWRHRLDSGLHGARQEAEAAVPVLGVGFSSLDMSLCVVLYVASSLFLMFMFFFFRVRAKRWKGRHHSPAV
ncbi:sulfhydryl oxidase 2 [Ochotona curzoniae]|uniref:sulfhydryl oxidase 2 n=1 Tax=Ochotona curzoniae TaxID=130825 RepID=UPI001B34F4F0|nr:sulfhydryl oxidase 2 [Ochotona curzoniae]